MNGHYTNSNTTSNTNSNKISKESINNNNNNNSSGNNNQFINYNATGYPPIMPAAYPPFPIAPVLPVLQGQPPSTNVTMNPDTTGYFGNISSNVSDDVLSSILGCTGGFKRLKRPVDPSTGKSKNFALVEYESVRDLARAFKLLQGFRLDNRNLSIKLEQKELVEQATTLNQLEDLKIYEQICRALIGKKWTGGGSMEWLEDRIRRGKEAEEMKKNLDEREKKNNEREESGGASALQANPEIIPHHRQRNYNDLVYEDSPEWSIEKKKRGELSASVKERDSMMALRERERRWEGKGKEFERELRRDLERDEERQLRHEREAAALAEFLKTFDDSRFDCKWGHLNEANQSNQSNESNESFDKYLFYINREKWKMLRSKALEREREIFAECSRIRLNLVAQEEASKIDQIKRLIETQIPVEREELFAYPIDWKLFDSKDCDWFVQICKERTCAFFSRPADDHLAGKVADFLAERIKEKARSPADLATEIKYEPAYLAVSEGPEDAEFLLALLWRWIIYRIVTKP